MSDDVRTFLTHALRMVDETGAWIRERWMSELEVERKADQSFVTEIDLEVERRLRDAILSRWPEHAVLGEEHGATTGTSEYRWLIDPVDGTMSLRCGVPLFGTILALHRSNEPLVGIIQLPALDRCYWAGRGLGTECNGRPVRVGDSSAVDSEIVALGDRTQFEGAGLETIFDTVMRSHPWARTYTDCFGHVLAVDGSVGAMIDVGLKAWDIAATKLLVLEAGGRFETIESGDPERWNVVFGKPSVVEWLMNLIDSAQEVAK